MKEDLTIRLKAQDEVTPKLNTMKSSLISVSGAFKKLAKDMDHANTRISTQAAKIRQLKSEYKSLMATTKTAQSSSTFPRGTAGFMGRMDNVGVIKQTGAEVDATSKKIANMNKSMSNTILKGLAVGIAIGIAYKSIQSISEAITSAIKSFREFQVRMAEVSTIVDIAGSDLGNFKGTMQNLSQGVRSLSKEYGKSTEDLARGLYDILSAAVPVEDSLNLLNISAKAASAGLTDVSTSVDVMTSVMNAYGFAVAQMAQVSDVMFKAVVRGKFRYEDLASALGYITPIAAQAGVSFEELAASISSATRQGQHVDMVSRGLALSIQNIIKPSTQAKEAALELGIDLSIAALQSEGLEGFLIKLANASKGSAAAISEIIPNMRSYRVMMVLASRGASEYTKDMELMSEALGETDLAFSKVADTVDMTKNILTSYREEMKRTVGESIYGLELLGITLGNFTTNYLNQWAQGFQTSTAENGFQRDIMNFVNLLSLGFGGAIADTGEQSKRAWSQVSEYINKDVEELTGSNKTPLITKLLEGEEFDTTAYQNLKNEEQFLKRKAVIYGKAMDAFARAKIAPDAKGRGEAIYGTLSEDEIAMLPNAIQDTLRLNKMPNDALIAELALDYQDLHSNITDVNEDLNYYEAAIGTISGGFKGDFFTDFESAAKYVNDLALELQNLEKEIGKVGELYDGTLGQKLGAMELSKPLEEMSHWISVASAEERYQVELTAQGYEWYTDEMNDAITVIREYEKAQKEATQAQNEFNFALAENRLETMKIQLLGMMRRRGNTRAETRMLKSLAIERTELQIEEAERELAKERELIVERVNNQEEAYQAAKELIEKETRDREHALWLWKDTRQQDIDNLKETIETKEEWYTTYQNNIIEGYKKMNSLAYTHLLLLEAQGMEGTEEYQKLKDYYEASIQVASEDVQSNTDYSNPVFSGGLVDILRRYYPGIFGSYASGTSYVPQTGPYMLHKGEAVIPANKNSESPIVVNVNVTGNTIDPKSEQHIAALIGSAVQKGLISARTGKSNYRGR